MALFTLANDLETDDQDLADTGLLDGIDWTYGGSLATDLDHDVADEIVEGK